MANNDAYQQAVEKLLTYMDQTVSFAKGQLPDIAQEVLSYGTTMAHFWMWFWIVFAVLGFIGLVAVSVPSDDDSGQGGAIAVMFFITFGLCVGAGFQYADLVKIEKEPKIYIIQQVRDSLR